MPSLPMKPMQRSSSTMMRLVEARPTWRVLFMTVLSYDPASSGRRARRSGELGSVAGGRRGALDPGQALAEHPGLVVGGLRCAGLDALVGLRELLVDQRREGLGGHR